MVVECGDLTEESLERLNTRILDETGYVGDMVQERYRSGWEDLSREYLEKSVEVLNSRRVEILDLLYEGATYDEIHRGGDLREDLEALEEQGWIDRSLTSDPVPETTFLSETYLQHLKNVMRAQTVSAD